MLYFRFDCGKENFKGAEHKSVLFGASAEDMAVLEFENEGYKVQGYYLDEYKKLQDKLFNDEITDEEYDAKFSKLVKEFIEDEWTLNGCSCFELTDEGIAFSNNYGYNSSREIITIFDGKEIEVGHDGEAVAKCEKVLWQGNAKQITNIFYDNDIEDKVAEVLKLIK